MKNKWIYNKTVIISGASGGLGFQLCKKLIEKYNCNIIGIARNESKLIQAKNSLADKKDYFNYFLMDVSVKENWLKLKDYLLSNNIKPDVLINNAGFMLNFAKFDKYSDDEIDEIIKTNLLSYINSTKILLPLIKESCTPAIVNVSSAAGLCAVVGQSMYCATKFGVKGFTETLQQEYKKQIYIGGVYPGFIKTDILNRQNADTKNNKLINKLMMPVEKASRKIIKGIVKRKKKIVLGFDGRSMSIFGRLFPKLTPTIITSVLKASKLDLFNDVFEYNKGNNK
jgi:short-subunit dehydrogenase